MPSRKPSYLVPFILAVLTGIVGWAATDRLQNEQRISILEHANHTTEGRLERIEQKIDLLVERLGTPYAKKNPPR